MAIKNSAKNSDASILDQLIDGGSNNGEPESPAKTKTDSNQNQNESSLEPESKPKKKTKKKELVKDADQCVSFTTPVNLYELTALRFISKEEDRSMRKTARRLWHKFIVAEAEKLGFNSNEAIKLLEEVELNQENQFK